MLNITVDPHSFLLGIAFGALFMLLFALFVWLASKL